MQLKAKQQMTNMLVNIPLSICYIYKYNTYVYEGLETPFYYHSPYDST